jgi:hypothetical protein
MDNLPQTFLFPPLKTIMAEFKPEGDHIHPLREEAKIETLKWVSRYVSGFGNFRRVPDHGRH